MNPKAMAIFITTVFLITSLSAAVFFDFNLIKPIQKDKKAININAMYAKLVIKTIEVNAPFPNQNEPNVIIDFPNNVLNAQCENRRAANDVFISRCTGEVAFNVQTRNVNPLSSRNLFTTLILTNSRTGFTTRIPLSFSRNGANVKRFSAGDLTAFNQWNIQVCAGSTCRLAQNAGRFIGVMQ